jgi:hypothetical protein
VTLLVCTWLAIVPVKRGTSVVLICEAITVTLILIGLFYLIVATASMMGFGTSDQQVAAFGASPSLMGTLGSSYIRPWFGDLVTLGTVISGFSCTLGRGAQGDYPAGPAAGS